MEHKYICNNINCRTSFPIIEGVPILINENNSIFNVNDFLAKRNTTLNLQGSRIRKALALLVPNLSANIKAKNNYNKFASLLLTQSSVPKVLVIGGSILGKGMDVLARENGIELVETDVSFGPRTGLICDAHDIPFADESFDGVIIQAVLEHVVDPYRCVEEIHRILKFQGLVYAETPFMQQVHMGRYDFTRFTHLGHRRLLRSFDEIESGAVAGPGVALAWAYQYFLLNFVESKIMRDIIKIFARATSFYLKYFDYLSIDKPGTLDSASGYYFIGRKANNILSDRELIKLYRGAM